MTGARTLKTYIVWPGAAALNKGTDSVCARADAASAAMKMLRITAFACLGLDGGY